jgi:hypothetical protein
MSPRRLVLQLLVLLAVLAAANGAVAVVSRHSGARKTLRTAEESPPADVLFLGNSLMAVGIDCGAFESAWPGRRALNLSLGASTPVEHLLILKLAGRHAGAEDVVYGFWDTQLTAPVADDAYWDLLGRRAMAYYADPEEAIPLYAADSPWRAAQMRLVSWVPLLAERLRIWAQVEKLRRRLGRVGLTPEGTNRFGRAADFAAFEAPDEQAFARQCRADAEAGVPLSEPVQALCRTARDRRAKLLLVEMPMTARHRRLFYDTPGWLRYRRHLEALARQEGGGYLSAADWVGDEHFSDVVHLNAAGAAIFSRRLAQTLRDRHNEEAARQQGGGH